MKNKERMILFVIITIFLMPSMVNTASADTGYEEYFFTEHDQFIVWTHDPNYMNDSDIYTQAWTRDTFDTQLLIENECSGYPGVPSRITSARLYIMAFADYGVNPPSIYVTPIYDGYYRGSTQELVVTPRENGVWQPEYGWSLAHPGHFPMQWDDIPDIDVEVKAGYLGSNEIVYVSELMIRVHWEEI